LIVTELAVIEPTVEGLLLKEITAGVSVQDVIDATEARLLIAPGLSMRVESRA
jgi:acetate CoA/acetoacetate CoA-transferase beta subunit